MNVVARVHLWHDWAPRVSATAFDNIDNVLTKTAADVIPEIVASSGLTQREFARRLGTSSSRMSTYVTGQTVPSADLLLRMYQVAREATTGGRGWPTAAQTAAQMQGAIDRGEDDWAFRLLIEARDRLPTLDEAQRVVWARTAPALSDDRWRSLFAAVVADAYARHEWSHAPAWAKPARLDVPWSPIPVLRPGRGPFDTWNITIPEHDLTTA